MLRSSRTAVILALLLVGALQLLPASACADDLDIYGGQTIALQPNVLIIFDNSGSMRETTTTTGGLSKLQVAKAAVTDLINRTNGVRFGLMVFNQHEGGGIVQPCGASKADLISAIGSITASTYTPLAETLAEAGLYFAGKDSWFNTFSSSTAWYDNNKRQYISPMQYACQKNFIIIMTDGEPTADMSKLANTLYINNDEIGDQDGDGCDPNGCLANGSYSSSNLYNTLNDSPGSDYLDDVAYYLSHRDCNPTLGVAGSQYEAQNIKVFTIGFSVTGIDNAARLLQATAVHGGGEYYTANDTSGLNAAFSNILQTLQEGNAVYTAPVIPRNPNNQTDAGDKVYMALFKPQANGRWIGNLKAFGLVNGVLKDSTSATATDGSGYILDTARSYWSAENDGLKVDFGGAGRLLASNASRNVYTFTGVQTALTHPNNKFTDNSNNPQITASLLGVTTTDERDEVISETLAGTSIRRSDGTSIANWRLGDIVHSEPVVKNFEATYQNGVIEANEAIKSYLFVGANDGMLHVFNAATGSEAWAFIPPGQLPNLKKRTTLNNGTEHNYFVDGSPVIEAVRKSDNSTMQLLAFGERRGGRRYYALDVTNPDQPLWKYQLTDSLLTGLDWDKNGIPDGTAATLGLSWAKPQFKKVRSGNQVKEVFLSAGGYDPGYDSGTPASPVGRALYTVLAETGAVYGLNINAGNWKDASNNPYMTHSILDVTGFDRSGLGYLDRIYAGDLGGNVFAARYNKCTNAECTNDGWEKMKLLDLPATLTVNSLTYNLGQKFMTKPEATIEANGSECVYFGTGDREHPNATSSVDAFYAICNKWEQDANGVLKTLTVNDLIDVTDNLLQQGTTAQQAQVNAALAAGYGWYIRLPNAGEKIVSTPKILNKKIYFTTFTPETGMVSSDPCTVSYDYGVSRLYVLDYRSGGAIYDYDANNALTTADRSIVIGTSIAAEPVLTTSGENTSIYVGSGGRIQGYNVESTPIVRRYFWRQLK